MSREHAILQKRVINLDHDGDRHVMCGWDDCENDGFELHKIQLNYGTAMSPHIVNVVFCSERHKQFYIEGSKHDSEGNPRYGRLPPGYRRSYI